MDLLRDYLGHFFPTWYQAALDSESLAEEDNRPAKQFLVLELLLGEPQQRAGPDLVPIDILQGLLGYGGDDELLHEGEDVAVGVAHDLIHLEFLGVVQTSDIVDAAQPVGQEAL